MFWYLFFFYCDCLIFFFPREKKSPNETKPSKSLDPPAERSIFPGSCTRTTPGTTTRRPAAAAPRRSSQTPSQAAAARSEVRSLPQATRYHKSTAHFTEVSSSVFHSESPLSSCCLVLFHLGIRRVAWEETKDPVTQIPFVFQ